MLCWAERAELLLQSRSPQALHSHQVHNPMFSWQSVHKSNQPNRTETCLGLKHFHMQRNGTLQPASQQDGTASRMQCVASETVVGIERSGADWSGSAREPTLQTPIGNQGKLATEGVGRRKSQPWIRTSMDQVASLTAYVATEDSMPLFVKADMGFILNTTGFYPQQLSRWNGQ